jgi:hypothetical protein
LNGEQLSLEKNQVGLKIKTISTPAVRCKDGEKIWRMLLSPNYRFLAMSTSLFLEYLMDMEEEKCLNL